MSSSMYTTPEGVVVVTHVQAPAPGGTGLPHCVGVQKFSKNRPLVLGTIQIIVGLTVLLFGIVTVIEADSFGAFSGFFVWGSLFYIAAGSLTVAAGKYLNRCLVNAAMILCIIAALVATSGTILYSLDAAGLIFRCYNSSDSYNSCYLYQTRMQGFSAVLAIFNFLELIVSIVVAAYTCNASCNCCGEPGTVFVVPAASVLPEAPAAAQPFPQVENNSKNPHPSTSAQPGPPTYDSIIS